MEVVWSDVVLSASMFTMMFGMGLTLVSGDFRRIATAPRATIVGTILQLIAMPIVGIAIAQFFGLSAALSSGIVVLAACPGGMFSNVMVHLTRGNTALSVTLTATATLVTLITLPLWIDFSLTSFFAVGVDPIEVPVFATALRLSMLTVLPIGIGMWVRMRWPEFIRFEKRFTWVGTSGILIAVVGQSLERPELPVDEMVSSIAPAGVFALAALLIGMTVPLFFRISPRDSVTIAVEMIVKNTLFGIVVVGQVLEFEAILPLLAYGIFQMPLGFLLLVTWRALERRGVLPLESDEPVLLEPSPEP